MTLNQIVWSFNGTVYNNAVEFNREVAQYQDDIDGDNNVWNPDEIVFDVPELQVQYMAWIRSPEELLDNERLIEDDQDIFDDEPDEDDMYQVEILAILKADNGKYFTALEFLQKAHNQQANKELGDHVFFEGTDETPVVIDGLPTCFIACGS